MQNALSDEKQAACTLPPSKKIVLDTRDIHAFRGWRLNGEPFSGHIRGSVNFSASWISSQANPDSAEKHIAQRMERRGMTPDKDIILCGTDTDAAAVYEYLSAHGFKKLHYFPVTEWDGETEDLPGYASLLPAAVLSEMLKGNMPPEFPAGSDMRLFEISWGKPSDAFIAGHIPGTVHIDSEEFEVGPEWVRVPDKELERFARENGITADTIVVIYGMDRLNMAAAAKFGVVLKYMGVKHVSLLDGGYNAWIRAGYSAETGSGDAKKPTESVFGADIPADPSAIVDIEEAKRIIADPSLGRVIDTRRWENFIGAETGYSYVPKAGRLPNTIWCWDQYSYTDPDGLFEGPFDLFAWWKENNVDSSRRMAFFCGSASWGAAVVEWLGRAADVSNAVIYEGGWCQWQLDPNNPYETGIPE